MPRSFGRGRWLSLASLCAAMSISIASVNSAYAGDGFKSVEQGSGRASSRDAEFEDHSEYPGLTIVKQGNSSKAIRKQAVAELPLDRISPEARLKSQAVVKRTPSKPVTRSIRSLASLAE